MKRCLALLASTLMIGASWATGILVVNAQNSKTLVSKQANTAFMPASNTKLFTAAAMYRLFSPTYHFQTTLSEKQNTLYLTFSGDPSLSVADLQGLLSHLPKHHHYHGMVLVPFPVVGPAHPLGTVVDDTAYCWSGAIKPATLNGNCLTVRIIDKDHHPSVQAIGLLRPSRIINHLNWANAQQLKSCVFQPSSTGSNQLTLQGCLPKRPQWTFSFAANRPLTLVKQLVYKALKQRDITLERGITIGKASVNAKPIAQHTSQDLQALLTTMLTDSNNLYAETFTVLLGQKVYGVPSLKAGSNAITHTLVNWAKINPRYFHLEDGAGESRYNLVSPHTIVTVLTAIYHDETLRPLFFSALAKGGKTGTLAHRFTHLPKGVDIYAKTGSMNGVSTLSGYLIRPHHATLIFSIMNNGIIGSLNIARQWQDQYIKYLLKSSFV